MMEEVREYIDIVFDQYEMTDEIKALRDEIVMDAEEHYRDCLAKGMSEKEAAQTVKQSLGDLGAMLREIGAEKIERIDDVAESFYNASKTLRNALGRLFSSKPTKTIREVFHDVDSLDISGVAMDVSFEQSEDDAARGLALLGAREGEGAVEAMQGLAEKFPSLEGYYPQPKKLIVSEILSYQGLTGIYSPFTVEANYNGDMTAYNIPFTACHELSHLSGFMQEEEANFIAFLACIRSDRADFQYSGYLSGWVYCMNALYRADRESWQEVRLLLDEAAEPDLEANTEFWDAYEGGISKTADKINDTYLKVNGQADGVQSYSRMVDLIVAYFDR